jgi:hypothetical protein
MAKLQPLHCEYVTVIANSSTEAAIKYLRYVDAARFRLQLSTLSQDFFAKCQEVADKEFMRASHRVPT